MFPNRSFLSGSIKLLYVCILPVMLISAGSTHPEESHVDLKEAANLVENFCTDWKVLQIDSMYLKISEQFRPNLPVSLFLNTYGKLGSFELNDTIVNDSGILVSMKLTFLKENPPTAVNGVHNFHLVKEGAKWKVKAIVPPIAPPVDLDRAGGGRPGL